MTDKEIIDKLAEFGLIINGELIRGKPFSCHTTKYPTGSIKDGKVSITKNTCNYGSWNDSITMSWFWIASSNKHLSLHNDFDVLFDGEVYSAKISMKPVENWEWTSDINTIISRIINNADTIHSFIAYARQELHDTTVGTISNDLKPKQLQFIAADFALKIINNCGFNIGKTPTTMDKEGSEVLLFNGRYWTILRVSELRDLVKGITLNAGLTTIEQQTHCFYNGIHKAILDKIPTTPEPVIKRVLLNLNNGTLEFLPDGTTKLYNYDCVDFQRSYLHYDHDINAKCPQFLTFLEQVLPDEESRIVIQELIGTLFIQSIKFEKISILFGMGSNGKSVFLKIIEELFGTSNISNMSLKDLTRSDKGPNNRAQLLGKRVNIGTELDSKGTQDHAMIKAMASREPIVVKWLYQVRCICTAGNLPAMVYLVMSSIPLGFSVDCY